MIKYHVNINKFSKISSEESAYWLGFLYADGCMSEDSRIGVMLKSSDKHHLEKLKDFLEWDNEKARYENRLDDALAWMRNNNVIPTGWGNEIKRVKK